MKRFFFICFKIANEKKNGLSDSEFFDLWQLSSFMFLYKFKCACLLRVMTAIIPSGFFLNFSDLYYLLRYSN